MNTELLSLETVAQKLSCSMSTVAKMVRTGELQSIKISKRCRRIPASEVARYLDFQNCEHHIDWRKDGAL